MLELELVLVLCQIQPAWTAILLSFVAETTPYYDIYVLFDVLLPSLILVGKFILQQNALHLSSTIH